MAKGLFTALFNALSDPKSYYAMQKEMNLHAVAQTFFNSLAGKTSFEAVVLPENLNSPVVIDGQKAIRVRPLGIYDFIIPEPCEFDDVETRKRILSLHPIAYPDSSGVGSTTPPEPQVFENGRVVECFYKDGPQSRGRLRGLTYRPNIIRIFDGVGANYDCLFGTNSVLPSESFKSGGYKPNTPTGEFFPDGTPVTTNFDGEHYIEKLEKRIDPSDEVITGVGSKLAADQAIAEINFWKDRDEIDAGRKGSPKKENPAYKRIQLYYYYLIQQINKRKGKENRETSKYFPSYASDEKVLKIGIKGDSTEGKGDSVTGIMHWSATSVSFCMRGTGFPAMEGHSGYTGKIINGEAPKWKAFSLIRNKIIPMVGDVVVKTAGHGRKGTVTTASHGDIIYRIDGNFAYTCGGNVGERGKFKESGYKIKLASDGTVFSPKPYIIILKKMK